MITIYNKLAVTDCNSLVLNNCIITNSSTLALGVDMEDFKRDTTDLMRSQSVHFQNYRNSV